jgi:hypothetical protein
MQVPQYVTDLLSYVKKVRTHKFGYFRFNLSEPGITARFTSDLGEIYRLYSQQQEPSSTSTPTDVRFLHQAELMNGKNSRGKADIGIFLDFTNANCGKVCYPIGVFECGMNLTRGQILGKMPQVDITSNFLFQTMPIHATDDWAHWTPLLSIVYVSDYVEVYMSCLQQEGIKTTVVDIMLGYFAWDENSIYAIVRLIYKYKTMVYEFMSGWHKQQLIDESPFLPQPRQTVIMTKEEMVSEKEYVYKSYDYRKRSVVANNRRLANNYKEYGKLNGFKFEVDNDDFKVIRYDKIDGDHSPRKLRQLGVILQELLSLHLKNVVHGDIRLYNMIFSDDGINAKLIDFDFAGMEYETYYPNGYLEVPDGERHPLAKSYNRLYRVHDLHSFASICSMFEAVCVSNAVQESKSQDDVNDESSAKRMKFNEDNSIELNLQNFVSGLLSSKTKSDEYPKGEVEKVINWLIDRGDVSLKLRPNSRLTGSNYATPSPLI